MRFKLISSLFLLGASSAVIPAAVAASPVPTLPDYTITIGAMGHNYFPTGAGTYTYSFNGAADVSTVVLGQDPSISASASSTSTQYSGQMLANLSYYVEYFAPGAGAPVSVNFEMGGNAQGSYANGTGSEAIVDLQELGGPNTYQSFGAYYGTYQSKQANNPYWQPLQNTVISMDPNVSYYVTLLAGASSTTLGQSASALVDPTFTVVSGGVPGGQFVFSQGISAPVPEPETYAMMLAGLGLMGFAARRKKK
jgi:hypothetical protein